MVQLSVLVTFKYRREVVEKDYKVALKFVHRASC